MTSFVEWLLVGNREDGRPNWSDQPAAGRRSGLVSKTAHPWQRNAVAGFPASQALRRCRTIRVRAGDLGVCGHWFVGPVK
jgi:hypothetical protein